MKRRNVIAGIASLPIMGALGVPPSMAGSSVGERGAEAIAPRRLVSSSVSLKGFNADGSAVYLIKFSANGSALQAVPLGASGRSS